jgi:hypothetical protein
MRDMALRGPSGLSVWSDRLGAAAALAAVAAILGFYASRLALPLPLIATDEGAYLIRALYPDEMVARNPYVADAANALHLSVIRAAYLTAGPYILIDRLINGAAYLAGLVALWWAAARGPARQERFALLLLAVGFAYYRFAVSNLAEGLYVGVAALICLATQHWYRSRPLVHAGLAGGLCAALVLAKPHGIAVVAALAVVAVADAAASRDLKRLPLRIGLFAVAFFAAGNLIALGAQQVPPSPWAFFMSSVYSSALKDPPAPDGWRQALLATQAMVGGAALLAGPPLVFGFADLVQRWRRERQAFRFGGRELVFLLLAASLAATVAMAAVYAFRISKIESEMGRLWGRYFEFFAPMLWLAAAPALSRRPISPGSALAAGATVLLGLAALLGALQAGVVLFPWDSSVLSAFFGPDAARAPFTMGLPYRPIAAALTLLAAGALALRAPPIRTGLALILALGLLSTWLDAVWMAPAGRARVALERDAAAIRPLLPAEPAVVILLTPDANDGHLGFLRLEARPFVTVGPPAQTSPASLADAQAVVVSGSDTPPGGPWTRVYGGGELSLWRRALPSPP